MRRFLEDHKPHVLVLGASSPEARQLEVDLKAIRDQILMDNPTFFLGGCLCVGSSLVYSFPPPDLNYHEFP